MITYISQLNQLSISSIRMLFKTLEPPVAASLYGLHRGLFVGPSWLRASAGPLLAITGLGGWWGKEFGSEVSAGAMNLVLRHGQYQRILRMDFVHQPSYLDGRPGLALRYHRDSPFPWPLIRDELRRIDENLVLGMTLVDWGPFRKQAFPFILHRREALEPI